VKTVAQELAELRAEPDVFAAMVRESDGALVTITELMTGFRVTLRYAESVPGTYDESWDYPFDQYERDEVGQMVRVLDGFKSVLNNGEPLEWYRHLPSNRRRPGGDASKEEIRP
jgi:D-alanyl-D-alanine dipeptidase